MTCLQSQDPTQTVASTVRSGSNQVDVAWRPSGLSSAAWPDLMAGPLTSRPLVLLVNSNTASASEVLAGGQWRWLGAYILFYYPDNRYQGYTLHFCI